MKRIGPFVCIISVFLAGCNISFQSNRKHSHRSYVKVDHPVLDNNELIVITDNQVHYLPIKHSIIPSEIGFTQKRKTNFLKNRNSYSTNAISTHRNKIDFHFLQKKRSLKSTRGDGTLPTVNILSLIFGVILVTWLAGLVLGIIGVALPRPKKGFGIAGICIGVLAIIALAVIVIIVL